MADEKEDKRNLPPHKGEKNFLEYLRENNPDIAEKFSAAEELDVVLAAHRAFSSQQVTASKPQKKLAAKLAGVLVNHWPIVLILFFALILRLLRVNFGMPYLHHYDEYYIMNPAIRMLKTGDFNPHFFRYPSLLIYLEFIVTLFFFFWGISSGALSSVDDIRLLWAWEITTPALYVWGRCLIALFGASSVFIIYLIGWRVYGSKKAGIAGALFLGVAEAHIFFSAPITVDVPMTFLVLASAYFSLRIFQTEKWSAYIAAGILGGLAISTKYNAFWVAVPYLLACLLSSGERKNVVAKSASGLVGFPLGFLVGTPYTFTEFATVVRDIGYEARHYGVLGHKGSTGEGNLLFFARWIFFDAFGSPLIPCLAIVGLGAIMLSKKRETLILLSFPCIHFFYILTQKVSFTRNMVPVLPFIAILAGLSIVLEEKLSAKRPMIRRLPIVAVVLVAIWTSFTATKTSWEVHRAKDTRSMAVEWMKRNIPDGSKVAIASELHVFMPELSGAGFEYFEIAQHQASRELLRETGAGYFVGCDIRMNRLEIQPLEQYEKPFSDLECIKTFDGSFTYLENPVVDPMIAIYKL